MGMAGLGDLVLTCTDNQSRNRRFGMMLGQGESVDEAQRIIGQVVEGYRNTKEVKALAARMGVEMPITEQIYQVLYCEKIGARGSIEFTWPCKEGRKQPKLKQDAQLNHLQRLSGAFFIGSTEQCRQKS